MLKDRIVDGDKKGLEEDLATAMKTHPPLRIINDILLSGMKVVGELFGAYQGVGELIYESKNLFDTSGVFAGMALLAAIALVAEALISELEKRLIKWRPPVATETRI